MTAARAHVPVSAIVAPYRDYVFPHAPLHSLISAAVFKVKNEPGRFQGEGD